MQSEVSFQFVDVLLQFSVQLSYIAVLASVLTPLTVLHGPLTGRTLEFHGVEYFLLGHRKTPGEVSVLPADGAAHEGVGFAPDCRAGGAGDRVQSYFVQAPSHALKFREEG